jgi:hypothetical protein
MRKLPVFKGYTVDVRSKEFRKIILGKLPEFIPFESEEGEKLLSEFLNTPEGRQEQLLMMN